MSIKRWSPYREMESMRNRIDRLLTDSMGWPEEWREEAHMPVDIQETDDAFVVRATMPGMKSEDVEVDVRDDILAIRGTSREERDEHEGRWHRVERRVGSASRVVRLPSAVNDEQAEAVLSDGVLKLTLPKQEESKARKITVKAEE